LSESNHAHRHFPEIQGALRHDEIDGAARAVLVFRNNAVDLAQNRQALAQQAAMLQEKLDEEQRLTLLIANLIGSRLFLTTSLQRTPHF
jgi:hypothetical protein